MYSAYATQPMYVLTIPKPDNRISVIMESFFIENYSGDNPDEIVQVEITEEAWRLPQTAFDEPLQPLVTPYRRKGFINVPYRELARLDQLMRGPYYPRISVLERDIYWNDEQGV